MTDAQFTIGTGEAGPVVSVTGELDLAVKDDLREVLTRLTGVVTVDLDAVTFLDSSVIGVLVGAHNRLAKEGGTLRLRAPQELPRRALEIVGLADWIED